MGADLIVADAFGHPRLWEKMLGGVTHDLLARMRLPIFMSHEVRRDLNRDATSWPTQEAVGDHDALVNTRLSSR